MRFKAGDKVVCKKKFSGAPGWELSMNEWLGKLMTVRKFSGDSIEVKENGWLWLSSSLELALTKNSNEQLVDKIIYLYERQQWVKEGKKEASYYIKQAVPNVGSKDMTEPEITSSYIPMDMNTALNVPSSLANVVHAQQALLDEYGQHL